MGPVLRLASVVSVSLAVGCVYGLTDLHGEASVDTGLPTGDTEDTTDDTGTWVTFDTQDTDDTDTTDTDPGTSPGTHKPRIDSFTAAEEATTVGFTFDVSDEDDDMDGGWATLEVGGASRTYRWPQDLDMATATRASTTWPLSDFKPEFTETVRLSVEDATARTASASLSFTRDTVIYTATEVGDDLSSAVNIGEIPVPSEISGTIWGCGNQGGGYNADTDMVKFKVADSKKYKLALTWGDGGVSDLDLFLLNTSNQELNKSASIWYPEELGHDLVGGTTYQIFVGCWSGTPGTWNVRITVL